MVGQHWLSFFSTTQFFPTGLMKGQTLGMPVKTELREKNSKKKSS